MHVPVYDSEFFIAAEPRTLWSLYFYAVYLVVSRWQISYMISAWARMCKIMGKEFEQYLPIVMGPVLKAAQIKPQVALVDGSTCTNNFCNPTC